MHNVTKELYKTSRHTIDLHLPNEEARYESEKEILLETS